MPELVSARSVPATQPLCAITLVLSLMHVCRPARPLDHITQRFATMSFLYLDLTRFSAQDIDKNHRQMTLENVSQELTPALRELMKQESVRVRDELGLPHFDPSALIPATRALSIPQRTFSDYF